MEEKDAIHLAPGTPKLLDDADPSDQPGPPNYVTYDPVVTIVSPGTYP